MADSAQTFGNIGAGVSDIFAGFADYTKAAGDVLEGQACAEAAALAFQNEQYTKMSTAIQEAQANRELLLSTGRTQSRTLADPAQANRPQSCARPLAPEWKWRVMSLQPIVFAEPLDAMIERARNSPCLLYTQKRTLPDDAWMSALCQERASFVPH